MRRRAVWAAAALLVAACNGKDAAPVTPETAPDDWPEGLYGNVTLSEFTGDLGGLEVRFFREGTARMAEFTLCEGWCNAAYIAEVRRDGDGFAVTHQESYATYDTQRGDGTATAVVTYRFTRAGDGLAVQLARDGQALEMGDEPWLIRPLERPFGLDVARSEQASAPR